jgi:hypothetical protein
MMKLMTDMQKRLSDLQRDVNQLKNEKFRPRQFDNTPRFNCGHGQAYASCLSDLLLYQIPCQQYCLLQLYVNMRGLPSPFVQLY